MNISRSTLILMALLGFVAHVTAQDWKKIKGNNYQINFQEAAGADIPEYQQQIESGIKSVNGFFGVYPKPFDVYIHPTRRSLDSTWQKDWSMPDFRSECWMVASGIATKLDMIAPKQWDQLACEHRYADKEKTQLLITHELVHVYHGQHNVSPDFSDVDGIDWLVEGLATYASGQCDDVRIAGVKKAVAEHRAPTRLDDFWKGDQKYGLSGSVVMYIDTQFGRAKLKLLLPLNNKSDVLSALGITEEHLLEEWKKYVGSLH